MDVQTTNVDTFLMDAFGNVLIAEVLRSSVPLESLTALIEIPSAYSLCYFYTWRAGACDRGFECQYVHDSNMLLRAFDLLFVPPRRPVSPFVRIPLTSVLQLNLVSFLEFEGKVVWARDSGEKSRFLWQRVFPPEFPLSILHEESFAAILRFLDILDVKNMLVALTGSKFVRRHRTSFLSPRVWESVAASKWKIEQQQGSPIQLFLNLHKASVESHAILVSAVDGIFTNSGIVDAYPPTGVAAFADLPPNASFGETILVSRENRVNDVRCIQTGGGDSLVALGLTHEVQLISGSGCVATSKQIMGCERVCFAKDPRLLVHAGTLGIFVRQVPPIEIFQQGTSPTLPLLHKIAQQLDRECYSLDATAHSVFAGYAHLGLIRFSLTNGEEISRCPIEGGAWLTSRMWSEDGNQHLVLDNARLRLWDVRVKTAVPIYECTDCMSLGLGEWGDTTVYVGASQGVHVIDMRNATKTFPLNGIMRPVQHIAVTGSVVALFTGSQFASPPSSVRTFDRFTHSPIGERSLPARVSAVCGQTCVFAVHRVTTRGREIAILCRRVHANV